jgi:hypothetical protein
MDPRRIRRTQPALGVVESIGWREGRDIPQISFSLRHGEAGRQ